MRHLNPTLRALWCIFLEYLMVLPLLYLLTGLMPPPMPALFLLSMLACAFIGVLTQRLFAAPWLQVGLGLPICTVGVLWLGLAIAGRDEPISFAVPAILACLIFYRGRQHALNAWHVILPTYAPTVIMVLSFIILAFVQYVGGFEKFQTLMIPFGILSLAVSFFAMNHINRRNLAEDQRTGSDAATTVSRRLSPQNTVLVCVLMGLGVLLSCMPWLLTAAKAVFGFLMRGIAWFFSALFRFQTNVGGRTAGEGGMDFGQFAEAQTHPFWDAFFRVAIYVVGIAATIVFVILAVLAVRNGIRLLVSLIRGMLEQRGWLSDQNAGFEDTHESLLHLSDLPRKYLDDLRARFQNRETRWNDIKTEGERVRYLYRHSLRRAERYGYRHKASYTPHEALEDAAEALPQIKNVEKELQESYERVRYAEREPAPGEAEELRRRSGL